MSLETPTSRDRRIDLLAYALISAITVFWMVSYQRIPEISEDASCYTGLAASLGHMHYQYDYVNHVNYPPGLPAVLLLLSHVYGHQPAGSYPAFMMATAAGSGLVLLLSYWLIRRHGSRSWALIYVLLVASSPFAFDLATRRIGSDIAYCLFSLAALLAFDRLTEATTPPRVRTWSALFGASFLAALTMRTIGVSLFLGLCAWIAVSWLRSRKPPRAALIVILLCGLLEQGAWFAWTKANYVRPAPGENTYDYSDDFKRIDPHRPDLGQAGLWDIAKRPVWRLGEEAAHVTEFFMAGRWANPVTYSPLAAIPAFLVLVGLLESLRRREAGLCECYFPVYVLILLSWPYDVGPRYLFPALPLCFTYLRRGWRKCLEVLQASPTTVFRALAAGSAVLLSMSLYAWIVNHDAGIQPRFATVFWTVSAVFTLWLGLRPRLGRPVAFRMILPPPVWKACGWCAIIVLCGPGILTQSADARSNLTITEPEMLQYPTAEAARWLNRHTPKDAVVMSFSPWFLYAMTGRHVVAFPPTARPGVILGVARKYRVQYLVVLDDTWYFPTQEERLLVLQKADPAGLEPVALDKRFRVFRFTRLAGANSQ
jgi:hypothetical protein